MGEWITKEAEPKHRCIDELPYVVGLRDPGALWKCSCGVVWEVLSIFPGQGFRPHSHVECECAIIVNPNYINGYTCWARTRAGRRAV